MDGCSSKLNEHGFSNAVICHANYAAFTDSQTICNRSVESRMSLWCKEGYGTVIVNGSRHLFHPGDYLFLPWKHRVEYQADSHSPFLLAGIHIIPQHEQYKPVEYDIAHSPESRLANCTWRRDIDLSPLQGIILFRLNEASPLWLLSEYITRLFITHDWDENRMRELAGCLLQELTRTFLSMPKTQNLRANDSFAILSEYLQIHLASPISPADLAQHMKCSLSTVGRLIRSHTAKSPVNWINQTRIHRSHTLLSTTRLSIAEIGTRVGIPDPFYFSKLFKQWTGESPLNYRKKTPLF